MCSENQANLKTVCTFQHRNDGFNLANVDEVFDLISTMTARSESILNFVANKASSLDSDLFWTINAVAMEIADIQAVVNAYYELTDDKGAE
jgi:hypothetical protein